MSWEGSGRDLGGIWGGRHIIITRAEGALRRPGILHTTSYTQTSKALLNTKGSAEGLRRHAGGNKNTLKYYQFLLEGIWISIRMATQGEGGSAP